MSTGLCDLHCHLDGSIRPSTVRELAKDTATDIPTDLCFTPGMGLQAALSRFAFTLSLLQQPDQVQRVASELCEDAAATGVTTLEIRFAPQLHTGAPMDQIVDAALRGINGRAGLILCALYGDPPALADALVDLAIPRLGVVGIDLAGGPAPHHRWGMSDLQPAFQRARGNGIGRTVHAGEGRPASEIRMAVELLHAQRIGHGLSVLDDPEVTGLVRDRGITIEACPTSNWQVGVIPSIEAHPLPLWLAQDLRVCINTDNTLLSDTDAAKETDRVRTIPGIGQAQIDRLHAHGHAARFCR